MLSQMSLIIYLNYPEIIQNVFAYQGTVNCIETKTILTVDRVFRAEQTHHSELRGRRAQRSHAADAYVSGARYEEGVNTRQKNVFWEASSLCANSLLPSLVEPLQLFNTNTN